MFIDDIDWCAYDADDLGSHTRTTSRELETNTVLKEFTRTNGNGYIRMQYAATLHEIYGYIVGFIVFVGTIKFIKLLRFNKRIGESLDQGHSKHTETLLSQSFTIMC